MHSEQHPGLARVVGSIRRSIPRLARAAIDRYIRETPLYTPENTPDHLHRESVHTSGVIMDLCLKAVVDAVDVRLIKLELFDLFDRAAERVYEGIPLREYMRAWHISFDVLAEELHTRLGSDHEMFWWTLCRARDAHDRMLREVVSQFEIYARSLATEDGLNHALAIGALLRGDEWIFDETERIPESPVVAILDIGEVGAEVGADSGPMSVARTRKVRHLNAYLVQSCRELWLKEILPTTGTLLLRRIPEDVESIAQDLSRVAGAQVTLAIEPAVSIADLPRAGKTAAEVLDLGMRCGYVGRTVQLADVALEHHFSHAGPALKVLLVRCEPLWNRTELVRTLRAYFECGQDRRRTAEMLVIHPNTVDNRLLKVRELTGLDVHVTADLLTLAVAVSPAVRPQDTKPVD
ncbi:helix-turn-helix domain-containing protein [Rhodococcus sp. IEGM 1318]|uniref:PucR family transcriptional regulator n=1 Tax=Rhodococcus sp. IEGM 1318 TaxID=3082226 RepID=UPI002954E529|nr:helix-turn-helix domain-containing protein [Rhodococcus sp. IEGM 1318]MDV8009370.1 helix-turn-helix domain-containing protein [Rhodococcus sp. IEGM 1318]